MMEVMPNGRTIPDGFKKYQQVLTLLPDDMLIQKLEEKRRVVEKAHYEILFLTNELEERKLI